MSKKLFINFLLLSTVLLLINKSANAQREFSKSINDSFILKLSEQDVLLLVDETKQIDLQLNGILDQKISVVFDNSHENYIDIQPSTIDINPTNESSKFVIKIHGLHPGQLDLGASVLPNGTYHGDIFIRLTVAISNAIIYISIIIGWMYFVAWSISFWPQIWINFKRKSVVGLNFDFLALNVVGHTLYAIFNVSLYWSSYIENEYFQRHPRGLNPVIANDVGFSVHAVFATSLTIIQCFIYERGEQRVSNIARGILGLFSVVIIISGILVATETLHWLDFIYNLSYIKLSITLIKYVPQAIMNYKRKSTIGWSIENVLLDFTGGILSMLQMILNAYNYDDWISIFGDPTKFGLGLFSVLFDVLFIVQHYVLYRDPEYTEITGDNNGDIPESNTNQIISDDNENVV
uniref:Cystinosin homolog n=1 Tax=Corethrella appendiculata TaxID=1370023 RepID=U5EI65_9DIPT